MKLNHTFVLYALTIGLAGYAALQHLAQQDLRLMLQGMPNRTVTPSATPDITAMQSAIAELRNEVAALREQLEERVYGWDEEVSSNAVEVHLHNLRRKLGAPLIRNVRGVGYCVARLDEIDP